MKYIFLLTFLFVSSVAQGNVIEIAAGGKFTHLSSSHPDIKFFDQAGFQFGAYYTSSSESSLFFRTGFLYSSLHFLADYDFSSGSTLKEQNDIRIHYIRIPLSLGVKVGENASFLFGPTLGFKIDESDHELRRAGGGISLLDKEPEAASLAVSAQIAFNIYLGNGWSFETFLERGFVDVYKGFSGVEWIFGTELHYEFF